MIRFLADASPQDAIVTGVSAVSPQSIFFQPMRPDWKEFPTPRCWPSPRVRSGFLSLPIQDDAATSATSLKRMASVLVSSSSSKGRPWLMSLGRSCWSGPLRTPTNGGIGSWRFLSHNREPRLHLRF